MDKRKTHQLNGGLSNKILCCWLKTFLGAMLGKI